MGQLPVQQVYPALHQALNLDRDVILCAPPGAGKSTALPLELLNHGCIRGQIIMLEPRRLATRTIAHYLAHQLGENVGQRVGYQMRGERCVSEKTQLLVVTEGVLTRLIQADPELSHVGLIIFDEFHERSLHADLGLALSLEVQQLNDRLQLLVMSATLDASALQQWLPEAEVLISEGRSYPVICHNQSAPDPRAIVDQSCRVIMRALDHEPGNILVFLPGAAEIRRCRQQLQAQLNDDVVLHCLYGQLSLDEQRAAIAPPPKGIRKIVLATNIAETSLTIDGIRVVIDTGLERSAQYHPGSGVTRLVTRMICQASAVQRAGRAGRQSPGVCYRLYSQDQLNTRPKFDLPQIKRSDLTGLVLQLCQWGVKPDELNWLDAPPVGAVEKAYALLNTLGLVTPIGQLTSMGQQACELGCGPRLAAMILRAQAMEGISSQVRLARACWLAAAIESNGLRSDSAQLGDALKQLPYASRSMIKAQAKRYFSDLDKQGTPDFNQGSELDGLLLCHAYPDRLALCRRGHEYLLSNGFGVSYADHQHGLTEFMVIIDLGWREGVASGKVYLSASISIDQLKDECPDWFEWHERCYWDSHGSRVIVESVQALGCLTLSRRPSGDPSGEQVAQAILKQVRHQGIDWLPWSDVAQAWHQRYLSLMEWMPELAWPDMTPSGLMKRLDEWLLPYLGTVTTYRGLKSLDWLELLRNQLAWPEQNRFDTLAPKHICVPSGRRAMLHYQQGHSPKVSLKLQEMFGQPVSPTIAQGRISVTLELLSPAGHPLQVTQDLASFWTSAYPEVQKEMKGRYPKHPWPDDPVSAVASSKTNRQLRKDK